MDQSVPIPNELRQFLEGIINYAHPTGIDAQVKEEIMQELFYQLDNYLANVITENLTDEDLDTFVKMNEEKKPRAEIENFVKEKIPNAQEVFTQAFVHFQKMYLEKIDAARADQSKPQP
ncbi:MAG TPA: DUF5663 domain-containing protein [Patescibacteria group bacterium]|nr:DUF5663 domain-containing protein [Patescibacteria group bacterium]